MTIRLSTKLRNNMVGSAGVASTFANGIIEVRTGTQPANADAAVTGTLLGTITLNSGAITAEVPASQTITLGGTSGSINAVFVGNMNIIPMGAVLFVTDATQTGGALAAAINANGIYEATSAAGVVTLVAPPGVGAAHNGLTLTTTVTTLTATAGGAIAGGVGAVNGLTFGAPSGGSLSKTGVWSCTAVAGGTAGWFRIKAARTDADGASIVLARLDGQVAIAGADMNISNTTFVVGSPVTIDTLTITMPAA